MQNLVDQNIGLAVVVYEHGQKWQAELSKKVHDKANKDTNSERKKENHWPLAGDDKHFCMEYKWPVYGKTWIGHNEKKFSQMYFWIHNNLDSVVVTLRGFASENPLLLHCFCTTRLS